MLLLSAVMLMLTIPKPIGFDNAMYQNMALDLYRFGKIPYIGSWDQNFPGIIYIHYVIVAVLGPSDFSVRWFDCMVQLLFAAFLYRFWSRWLRPRTAALTAVLYISYYVSAGGLLLAERDVYCGMLILVSVYLVLHARERPGIANLLLIVAGLIAGMGLVLRPSGIVSIAIIAASLLVTEEGLLAWRLWPRAMIFVIASLVPFGMVLAFYAGIPHGLENFYLATVRWNLDLYSKFPNGPELLVEQFARRAFLGPFMIYGLVQRKQLAGFFLRSPTRRESLVYASLALSSLLIAVVMRKYFDYHFAPFFMLAMPIAALGIEAFASRFRKPVARRFALVLSAIAATCMVYNPKVLIAFSSAILTHREPFSAAYAKQYPSPYWGAKAEWATNRYLNRPENRDGLVEVCTFTTNLQLHLRRERAGKYGQLVALSYRTNLESDSEPPRYTSYQLRWQREYIDSLRIKQPRFIVLARNTHFMYFDDVYNDLLKWIPGFDSLLSASYRYDTAFGGYQIFQVRSSPERAR